MSVLNCLYDSVSQILRKNVEKRAVLDSLDIVMLAMDEICDGGWAEYSVINIELLIVMWQLCASFQHNLGCGCNECGAESSIKNRWHSTWGTNGGTGNSLFNFMIVLILLSHILLIFIWLLFISFKRSLLLFLFQFANYNSDCDVVYIILLFQVLQSAKEQLKWSLLK